MWKDIIAGVLGFLAIAVPANWLVTESTRRRKALAEEADLLARLPDDLEAKSQLREHLEFEVSRYVAISMSREVRSAKNRAIVGLSIGYFAAIVGTVGLASLDRSPWGLEVSEPGDVMLMIVWAIAAAGSLIGTWNFHRWRRESFRLRLRRD